MPRSISTGSTTIAAIGPKFAGRIIMNALPMSSRRACKTSSHADSSFTFDADFAPLSSRRSSERLLETPYCTLNWDGRRALARFVRTELPYATSADIDDDGLAIQHVLERPGKIRLLVDLRSIVPRNDPSFETSIAGFRRRVLGGRQRVAIVVRTAMGALQVKRHIREDGFEVEVFTSEEEALAYLDMRPSERTPLRRHDWTGPQSRS